MREITEEQYTWIRVHSPLGSRLNRHPDESFPCEGDGSDDEDDEEE